MTPVAASAMNIGKPASTRRPTKISTAIAAKNAKTGLSSTELAIMDNCAQVGRLLMAGAHRR
jgi:hypothetical protein